MTVSLLILFTAGLVAHGIHELQEARLLPGSILNGFFGYNGNPSILEVIGYSLFLSLMAVLFLSPRGKLSLRAST